LSSEGPQVEKDPTNPDLKLRLSAGVAAHFESFTERDALSHVFQYQFVVPTAAIPPDGLRLEVLDADAGGDAETLGVSRIDRETVARALSSVTGLIDLESESVRHLEVIISPYTAARIAKFSMPANEGLRPAPVRALIAGEVVNLTAQGQYSVGSWYALPIGPAGYPNGDAQGYNLSQQPFASAPHACGIAMVKSGERVEGVVVGISQQFTSRYAGRLSLGVNDQDPANNTGSLSFEGTARAPTADEWKR
jgi:hypothetical protein